MHIVVAVDGSPSCASAIKFLNHRKALQKPGSNLDLLNVQYLIPEGIRKQFEIESVDAFYESQGRLVFEEIEDTIKSITIPHKTVIKSGELAPTIVDYANTTEADLIAMGSRGHSALFNLLLGSVSNAVLARTKKPVLLVHKNSPMAADPLRVGIAVDGSEYGQAAAKYIIEHKDFFGENATFTVMNVVPDFPTLVGEKFTCECMGFTEPSLLDPNGQELDLLTRQQEAFKKVTDPIVAQLLDAGLKVESARLEGVPHKALAWYAKKNCDLLICGSHGRGAFERAVLGTTAMHLASDIDLPLLIIR